MPLWSSMVQEFCSSEACRELLYPVSLLYKQFVILQVFHQTLVQRLWSAYLRVVYMYRCMQVSVSVCLWFCIFQLHMGVKSAILDCLDFKSERSCFEIDSDLKFVEMDLVSLDWTLSLVSYCDIVLYVVRKNALFHLSTLCAMTLVKREQSVSLKLSRSDFDLSVLHHIPIHFSLLFFAIANL